MRSTTFVLALAAALLSGASATVAAPGTAVVELFTSEGCSSCPPADRLLSELVAEDRPGVVCLAFHVDYWDRLGWPDRFADAEFSERQRRYAGALGERRVFTPQAVVNGHTSLVGSDEPRLRAAIADAVGSPPTTRIAVDVRPAAGGRRIEVVARLDPPVPGAELHVAIVERGLETRVERGENAARTLRHDNVVRAFVTTAAGDGETVVDLELPPGLDRGRAGVVALAQDPRSMEILGATEHRWTEPGAAPDDR